MEKETARIEAFSDAVFAIAITLLILDLHVPDKDIVTTNNSLARFLVTQWPSYAAFGLSFFSIFVIWVNHHKIFKQIYQRNTAVMFSNGAILFLITILSYPTALLAKFYNTESGSTVTAIYTGVFVLINLSFNWLWYVAGKNRSLLRPDITVKAVKQIRRNYLLGFPVYVVAFCFSFYWPTVALVICAVMWLFWIPASAKLELET